MNKLIRQLQTKNTSMDKYLNLEITKVRINHFLPVPRNLASTMDGRGVVEGRDPQKPSHLHAFLMILIF